VVHLGDGKPYVDVLLVLDEVLEATVVATGDIRGALD
jgi:hypothetical protein